MAITALKNEKKYQEQLHRQLERIVNVDRSKRDIVEEFLQSEDIYSLEEVEEVTEIAYRQYVYRHPKLTKNQKERYAPTLEMCMLHYLLPGYPCLEAEMRQYGNYQRGMFNKTIQYLMLRDVKSLEHIDYSLRCDYVKFLESTGIKKIKDYVKVLDCLKLWTIEQKNCENQLQKRTLRFSETPIFLGYHPDYAMAMTFYYIREKEELVFDFSLSAPKKMKRQIFDILNACLEKTCNSKNRRELYIVPLKKLYLYCVAYQLEDIQSLEIQDIEGFRQSMIGKVGTKIDVYMQIVQNAQKYLFIHAERTNWEANVWFLERFTLKEERINPSSTVPALKFYQVMNRENRSFFQLYMKYLVGISSRAISSVLRDYYNISEFLVFADKQGISVLELDEDIIKKYIQDLEERDLQEEAFNRKLMSINRFFLFLVSREYINKVPFRIRFFMKKVLPVHHDRSVPVDVQEKILSYLKFFPTEIRLMYLHLWALGLRLNEVCCLKGNDYFWRGQNPWIRIRQYKMKNEKIVPIPESLFQLMETYIEEKGIQGEEYVFKNKKGGAYKAQTFSSQMKRLCVKYGITCEDYVFRSHDYRHNVATTLYDRGVSIESIRDYLGHREEDMTKQYIDYIPQKIEQKSEEYFQSENNLSGKTKRGKEHEPSNLC